MNSPLLLHPLHTTALPPGPHSDRETYTALIRHMQQGYCIIEVIFDEQQPIDYRFLEVNPRFEQLTGLVDAVGKTMRQLQPAHEQHWFELYGQVVKTGQSVQVEQQAAHLAGGVWYDVFAFPLGSPQRNQVGILFTDRSESKMREQQGNFLLRFSDTLRLQPNPDAVANCALQLLLEQLGLDRCYIGVYRLEEDRGEFTHQVGNERVPPVPASVRLSDFPDALRVAIEGTLVIDDVGKTAGLTGLDRQNLDALGFAALVASTLRRGERNPLWSIVAISARPRRWTAAEIKLIDEVTERTWTAIERVRSENALSQREEQLRQLSVNLERQVQQRTGELAAVNHELALNNQALAEANGLLVRSNANLQTFAYVASHDLQEPLRKIQQFGDLLKQQYAAGLGDGVPYLERMQSAASRMSILIKDLLNFSRISTQRDTSEPVALEKVLGQVLSTLELALQETGAQVSVGPLPTVMGDASQLNQLFQNLLANALKFRRPGVAPHIAVKASWLVTDHLPEGLKLSQGAIGYHRIDVADNGIGFDEAYLDRIFQMFQRLHGKSTYAGTGIGLAICEKVVANHGGAITATSQPGQGATFTIYLPA